ncbi:MAG: DUF1542 domain-containing protein [Ruminococcaceae bacterium]|nr:DUF1542 domain-containing protein [Oscillospiraceae bacterium]
MNAVTTKKISKFTMRDRILALAIVFALVLSTVAIAGPFTWAKATSEATSSGIIDFDDAEINYDSKLKDNEDGTYSFNLDLWATISQNDENITQDVATESYFVAPFTGKYLFELWGGSGANGQDSRYNKGGVGGDGGHIYGYINLNKGDIIYYTLGGKGEPTLVENEGGGANGGGGHGDTGSYRVGGGGGYSAVYLFKNGVEANNFIATYTDGSSNVIKDLSETDRTSKYVMVAGGAGGGGAGDGFLLGYKPLRTANGGNGGSVSNSPITVTGGVVFAGQDGISSSNPKYVGYGGSNVPGPTNSTALSFWDGSAANNWDATVVAGYPGGYGASGNLRGGAGGAGYCGGSGGIMTSALIATNVGGGGGGSSYIANSIDYVSVPIDVKNRINPNIGRSDGGYFDITFIGTVEGDNPADITWLKELEVTTNISKYFEVTAETTSGDATVTDKTVKLSNAKLNEDGKTTLTLTLTPKNGFKGGNSVNLFADTGAMEFIVKDTQNNKTSYIDLPDDLVYVNVPLQNFDITTNSLEANPGDVVPVTNLYTDNYETLRGNLTQDDNYDFIESISTYFVKTADGSQTITAPTIEATESAVYQVGVTAVPKTRPIASVGNAVMATDFTSFAFIDVLAEVTINGIVYSTYKKLTYDTATNKYKLELKLSSSNRLVDKNDPTGPRVNDGYLKFVQDPNDTPETELTTTKFTSNGTFTVQENGVYMIQVRGGNGGASGKAISKWLGTNAVATGNAGGPGAYHYAIVRLKKNETVTFHIGENGAPVGDVTKNLVNVWGNEGNPGTYTEAIVNGNTSKSVLAGAGGGGGGALARVITTSDIALSQNFTRPDGKSPIGQPGATIPSNSYNTATKNLAMKGEAGYGSPPWNAYPGVGGVGGASYNGLGINTSLLSAVGLANFDLVDKSMANSNANPSGAISLLQKEPANINQTTIEMSLVNKLTDLDVVSYEFSNYFKNVTITRPSATDFYNAIAFVGPVTIGGIKTTTVSLTGVKWIFEFEPIDGLLGGNFIEAVESITLAQAEGKKFNGTTPVTFDPAVTMPTAGLSRTAVVPKNPTTDYVNYRLTNPITGVVANEVFRVPYGTVVDRTDLFTITGTWPTGLQDDYVSRVDNCNLPETGYLATTNKDFTYEYGIEPVNAVSKAKVDTLVKADTKILTAKVLVYSTVDVTGLKDMTYSGPTEVDFGSNLQAIVTPASGFDAPDSITITSGDTTLQAGTDYTYDKLTGAVTVQADSIKGTIVISATGVAKEYKLHFVAFDQEGEILVEDTKILLAGTPITNDMIPSVSATEKKGFNFAWDWNTADGNKLDTMPGYDYWVYGSYEPYFYTIKIRYVDMAGFSVAEDYVNENAYYTLTKTVPSPIVDGMKLNDSSQASITYTLDETFIDTHNEGTTVVYATVRYIPKTENITVVHKLKDTGEIFKVEYVDVPVGSTYFATAVDKPGYEFRGTEPIVPSVPAGGVTLILEYEPKTLTVHFVSEEDFISEIRTVKYNEVYADLPIPTSSDPTMMFAGWYTLPNGAGEKITEDTVVTTPNSHTLYAKWIEEPRFTVDINPSGWSNTNVTFTLSGTNEKVDYSTVVFHYSTNDGLSYVPMMENTLICSTEGISKYYFKAVSSDEEEYIVGPVEAKIDKNAPTGSITISEDIDGVLGVIHKMTEYVDDIFGTHFTKEKIQAEIEGDDLESGVKSIEYGVAQREIYLAEIVERTDWSPYTGPLVLNVSVDDILEGKYYVYAKITDNAGNIFYLASDGMIVDTTKPTVNAISNYDTSWINANTENDATVITGTIIDKALYGSGLKNAEYKIGNGEWQALTLAGDGTFSLLNSDFVNGANQTVYIRAYDNVGNVSEIKEYKVNKDTVLPEVSISEAVGTAEQWSASETATIMITTGVSGVSKVECKDDANTTKIIDPENGEYNVEITKNGTYVFRVTSVSGNVTTITKTYSYIDTVVPEFTVAAVSKGVLYDYDAASWTNGNVTFSITKTSSNESEIKYYYQVPHTFEWVEISDDEFTVSAEGQNLAYKIKAVSNSGVESSLTTVKTSIEKIAPTGTITVGETTTSTLVNILDPFNIFYNDAVSVVMTSKDEDGGSGVESVSYYLTQNPMTVEQLSQQASGWINYTAFNIIENNEYIVYGRIIDNAGNVTFISSDGFIVDTVAPRINADLTEFKEEGWTITPNVKIPITIADDQSVAGRSGIDVDRVTYSYSESAPNPFSNLVKDATVSVDGNGVATFTIPNSDIPNGIYTITITAYDLAGNMATLDIYTVRDEGTVDITAHPTNVSVDYGDPEAVFTVTATPPTSGITSYQWEKAEAGTDIWNSIAGETTNTLTITNPTVVSDNGDRFRVVITSGAGVVTISDPALLSVQKAILTITPNDVFKNYGQLEKPLTYDDDGYKFEDESKVTFTGGFVRDVGEEVGTYTIRNKDFDLADDTGAGGENVNGNYTFVIEPETATYEIKEYDPDIELDFAAPNGANGWYISSIRFNAPTGYLVSITTNKPDANWDTGLDFDLEGMHTDRYYYLRNVDDTSPDYLSISVKKIVAFNLDRTNPTIEIKCDEFNFWTSLLETITFGIFSNTDKTLTISANDVATTPIDPNRVGVGIPSGVDKVEYFKSETVCTTAVAIEAVAGENWISLGKGGTVTIARDEKAIVYAKVTDFAGHVTYASSIGLIVEDDAPEITFEEVNSSDTPISNIYEGHNYLTNDTDVLKIDVTEMDTIKSGLATVKYGINGGDVVDCPALVVGSELATIRIPASSLDQGENTIVVTTSDRAGNFASATYTVYVDTVVPGITMSANTTKIETQKTIELIPTVGITGGKVFISKDNGGIWTEVKVNADEKYIFTVTDAELDTDGKVTYVAKVVNGAGIEGQSVDTVTFDNVIDPRTPDLKVTGAISGWTNQNIQIDVENLVNNLGIDEYYYTTDPNPTSESNWIEINPTVGILFDENQNQEYTIAVKAENGLYDMKQISIKLDKSPPKGKIKIETSNWDKFLETITFGIYTAKDATVVIVKDEPNFGSGTKSVKYIKTEDVITDVATLKARVDWIDYVDAFVIPAEDGEKFIIYAEIVDNAGNETYLSSEGYVFDTVQPTITASSLTAASDSPAYGDRIVTVEDTNLKDVTITIKNGDLVAELHIAEDGAITINPQDNSFILEANVTIDPDGVDSLVISLPNNDKTYLIEATDKTDREDPTLPLEMDMRSIDTFIAEINAQLPKDEITGEVDLSKATDEKLVSAIEKIDSLLIKETNESDNGNLSQDEVNLLNEKRNEFLAQIKTNAIENLNASADVEKSKIDSLDGLTDTEKEAFKSEVDANLQNAINQIQDSSMVEPSNIDNVVTITIAKFSATVEDAMAQEFVNTYASDDDGVYDKTNNKMEGINADQVVSGSDAYDNHTDMVQAKIDVLIAIANNDGSNTYADYPEMKQAAIDALANAKTAAKNELDAAAQESKNKIEAMTGLTDAEKYAHKAEIDEVLESAKQAIENSDTVENVMNHSNIAKDEFVVLVDDATAHNFVNLYASENRVVYDKGTLLVTAENADQIINGSDIYEGYSASIKNLINDLILAGNNNGSDTYADYPEMLQAATDALDAAKVAAEEIVNAAAQEAIAAIEAMDNLTPEEKEAYKTNISSIHVPGKQEIYDAKDLAEIDSKVNDMMSAFQDVVDEATAKAFVRKYASNENGVYDKGGNPLTADDSTQIDSGETTYNNYTDSIRDKIDALIVAGNNDGSNTYPNYPEMNQAAINALAGKRTSAKDELAQAAQDAKDVIDDLPYLTSEYKQAMKDGIDEYLARANMEIDEAHSIAEIDAIVEKYKDVFKQSEETAIAFDFMTRYCGDEDGFFDRGNNRVGTQDTDVIIEGEPIYENFSDSIKEKIDYFVSTGNNDGSECYEDYPGILKRAKEIVQEVADGKVEITKAAQAAKDRIDALPDLSDEEKAAFKDEIDAELQNGITRIDNAASLVDFLNILDETHANYENIVDRAIAQDLANRTAAVNKFIENYLLSAEKTYPENKGDVYGTATKENAKQIADGKDDWDKLSNVAKDEVNAAIALVKGKEKTYPELLLKAEFILGDKEVEFVKINGADITVEGLDELFNNDNIFTDEDRETISQGGLIRIENVVTKEIKTDLTATEQLISDDFLKTHGLTAVLYLDISIYKHVYERDVETGELKLLYTEKLYDISPNKITYALKIPAEFIGKGEFQVIRIHNGVPEIIATAPAGSTEITFETDKFSTYILAYKDKEKLAGTMDENCIAEIGLTFALSALMFVATKRRKEDVEEGELN